MGRRTTAATRGLVAVVLTAVAAACSGGGATTAPSPTALGELRASEPFGLTTVTLRPPSGSRSHVIPVYDAFVPAARGRGLMHRRQLPRRAGTVFRFPDDHSGGFWMKNTLIPLSIAFFDAEGTVLAVLDMAPCRQPSCPSYDPGVAYRGALEVNQGFFDDIGLEPGWVVDLPAGLPSAS